MLNIRKADASDFAAIWPLLHEVFAKGDTYSFSPAISKEECFHIWMEVPLATYVATDDEQVVGTYFLKPNQPGLGSHVCNAGYAVSAKARGKGIGRAMCEHSLKEARAAGFKAMQYNFVVSTNQTAVKLWERCGFQIVGKLPNAFRHKEKGFVDTYVMYQWLG
jgi:ribosomal protein S18 acetylase RimI-like enzyme